MLESFSLPEFNDGNCQEEDIRLENLVNSCSFLFTIPQPDFIDYFFTFNVISRVQGYPSLDMLHSVNVIFDYPAAVLTDFGGPSTSGDVMEVNVYYPYPFGIAVVTWLKTSSGDGDR